MIGTATPLPHFSEQLLAPLQLNEHEPVQATVQREFGLQLTLPLGPRVKLQVELPWQSRLALAPALKEQVDPPLQPPLHEAPQLSAEQVPLGQLTVQLVAVQFVLVQPDDPPPQPARTQPITTANIHFIETSMNENSFVATARWRGSLASNRYLIVHASIAAPNLLWANVGELAGDSILDDCGGDQRFHFRCGGGLRSACAEAAALSRAARRF